jgi:hypothetical protein
MKVRHLKHAGFHSWRQRAISYVGRMKRGGVVVTIRLHPKCVRVSS